MADISNRCSRTLLLLTAVLAVVPSVIAAPKNLLSKLADKSICESVVTYDNEPDRIPRIIKQVKCAEKPDKMCPARDGDGETSCCSQNSYKTTKFLCEEMFDQVMVKYKDGDTKYVSVPVGCACVMTESIEAIPVDLVNS